MKASHNSLDLARYPLISSVQIHTLKTWYTFCKRLLGRGIALANAQTAPV